MWYATQNDCVYVTSLRDWSVLWMYQDILTAMGIYNEAQPKRKKQAFEAIAAALKDNPRVVIMDEADLIQSRLLETVRDLCKITRVPWVLVGEENLAGMMSRDRRVWSRCCAAMEFEPMSAADIIMFCRQTTDLLMTSETADIIQRATEGDIRRIELTLNQAETVAKANNSKELTSEIAKMAIKKTLPEKK